ncbi:MAG: AbrB/MazE/SpoVT family DNA-binding domain-containing protein [Pseudomonadota bacterium]
MSSVKVRAIGNSLGVVIPKEILDRHRIEKDDELHLVETERGIELHFFDADLEDATEWIEKGAKKYRNTLRALAQ